MRTLYKNIRRRFDVFRAKQKAGFDRDGVSGRYVMSLPGEQNAIDIFKGDWSSKLPEKDYIAGRIPLFRDDRLLWFIEECGGVEGASVLELGPLEAGHSYLLSKHGAKAVTAIEAHRNAFLKCLIIKEVYDLKNVKFLLGDFLQHMEVRDESYDICIASGVLYHMEDPIHLLKLISMRASRLFLWTHYCDPETTDYTRVVDVEYDGMNLKLYEHSYETALGWGGFCGGSGAFSNWMTREDILSVLRHLGFEHIETAFEQPEHPRGPAFALAAFKHKI